MSDFLSDYSGKVTLKNLYDCRIPQLRKVEIEKSMKLKGQAWLNLEKCSIIRFLSMYN